MPSHPVHTPPDLAEMNESEQCQEVYAWAGLALYFAQVFEQGVANLLFVAGVVDRSLLPKYGSADAYWADVSKMALGRVLKKLRQRMALPSDLDALCTEALRVRNLVAHRFFVDGAERFMTQRGRASLLDELHEVISKLQAGDDALERVLFQVGATLNLSPEVVAAKAAEMKWEAEAGWT